MVKSTDECNKLLGTIGWGPGAGSATGTPPELAV